MYKWEKYHDHDHEYDSKNPTFSSSLLDKINKSLKNSPKNEFEDNFGFFRATKDPKTDKVSKKSKVKSCKTLLQEFDVQDTLFFGTTSTSSSSPETDYSVSYNNTTRPRQQQKPRVQTTCFAQPLMPKPVKTRPAIESKFLEQQVEEPKSSSRSRAVKMYSNLKNLKQPISPGVRLTTFINSLFAKDNENKKNSKTKKKNGTSFVPSNNIIIVPKSEKLVKTTSYSACTTPTSYSRSCFSNKKSQDDGINKRTVRFCPVSVILDEESRPCGEKPVFNKNPSTKFGRSLSKRYDELKILNGLNREDGNSNSNGNSNSRKVEKVVTLDLLSGYSWDRRVMSSKCNDQSSNKVKKVNSNNNNNDNNSNSNSNSGGDRGNYGVNYGQRESNYCEDEEEDDDDGLSCSSSDLFELDHLSLIGNGDELPVYETTTLFDPKLH